MNSFDEVCYLTNRRRHQSDQDLLTDYVPMKVGLWHEVSRSSAATSADLVDDSHGVILPSAVRGSADFRGINHCCRQITQASRCCRSMEVIVQARWIQFYDEHVQNLVAEDPGLTLTKAHNASAIRGKQGFRMVSKGAAKQNVRREKS